MGQGRHTLRSVSDPVYPLGNLEGRAKTEPVFSLRDSLTGAVKAGKGRKEVPL